MVASLLAVMAVVLSFFSIAQAAAKVPTVIVVGAGMSGDIDITFESCISSLMVEWLNRWKSRLINSFLHLLECNVEWANAGISAAKTLSDAGIKNILILEATDRIGGRIHKTNFAGLSVEMGANWVEGVGGSEMNPIWEMVNKIKLKTFFSDYDNVSSNTYKQV